MADAGGSARQKPTPRVRTPYATNADLSGGQVSSRSRRRSNGAGASRGSARAPTQHRARRGVVAPGGHRPPVYNIYGNQLPPGKGSGLGQQAPEVFHTREGRPHVPTNWTGTPAHTRPEQVREARRREFLADPSFDLDGDGVVNQRDYFLAKQFDKDGDGKLNARVRWQRCRLRCTLAAVPRACCMYPCARGTCSPALACLPPVLSSSSLLCCRSGRLRKTPSRPVSPTGSMQCR